MARLSDRNNTITFVPQPQSPDVAGFVKETSDDVVPDGWLECNGQAVSRTTYSELFAKIGTTYGAGDGSTTFNLPGGSLLTNPVVEGDLTVDTDTLFVDSTNNLVGIGTTSPMSDAKLTLSGVGNVGLAFQRTGSTQFESGILASGGNLKFLGGVDSSTLSGLNELMTLYASDGMDFKPSTNSIKRFTGGVYPGSNAARDILTVATDNTSGFITIQFTSSRNFNSAQGARSHRILTYWYSTSKGPFTVQSVISVGTTAGAPTVNWDGDTLTLAQSGNNEGGAYILEVDAAWNGGSAPTFNI